MDQNELVTPKKTSPWVLLLRIGVVASVTAVLVEFITAGQLITYNMEAQPVHYAGAFAVHAATGVQLLGAVMVWFGSRQDRRGTPNPDFTILLVSLGAFAVAFPQAALGTYGPLQAHVPLAMVLVGLIVWSAVLVFRRRT